jgi:hypothetical protein
MVKGNLSENEEDDYEYHREEIYRLELDQFLGVPGTIYGLEDELDNLIEVIRAIGESVVQHEKEFGKIYDEEFDPETSFLSNRLLNNWFKKRYRIFSYKAILILIHSLFEKSLIDLFYLLRSNKRISFRLPTSEKLTKLLEGFSKIEPALLEYLQPTKNYLFLRNIFVHNDGAFRNTDRGAVDFLSFAANKKNIAVTNSKSTGGRYTHQIKIKNSSLLIDYVKMIKQIFILIINKANVLSYLT